MLRRSAQWNRLLKGLAIAIALVSSSVAPAAGEEALDPFGAAARRAPNPRKERSAEAALPGAETTKPGLDPYVAKDSVKPNMTLLADPARSPLGNTVAIPAGNEQVLIGSLKTELDATKAELAKTKEIVGEVIKEYKQIAESRELPPLKDAEVRVFPLKNTKAADAADKVELLFGTQPLRIAVDDASNGLIVFGKAEAIPQVEQLIIKLDDLAVASPGGFVPAFIDRDAVSAQPAAPRRTLMLRIFWLAHGVQDMQSADDYLPRGVIESLAKLGLDDARVLTQTVNSLSAEEGGGAVEFSTNVPALLFQQPVTLTSSGTLNATTDSRAEVEIQLSVAGPGVSSDLKGSLTTPLGHYMVLGTANSVIPEQQASDPAAASGEGMGMGMPMAGGAEMPGAYGMAGMPPAKYNASRFAFVVQVIEAESFEPEGNGQ